MTTLAMEKRMDDLPIDNPMPKNYLHETLRYPCGCEASGAYPLPTYCPEHGSADSGAEGMQCKGCGGVYNGEGDINLCPSCRKRTGEGRG